MKTLHVPLAACTLLFLFWAAPANAQESEKQAEKPATIITVAENAGTFTTLLKALDAAELTTVLQGDGPFTVFAPTDEAFAKLPEGTLETLLEPANKERLAAILTYHVVSGQATASDASEMTSVKTLGGNMLPVTSRDDAVMVNDATVVQSDVEASNGIIHVIDTVLMPPSDMDKDQ